MYFEAAIMASNVIVIWPDFCIRFVFVFMLPPTVLVHRQYIGTLVFFGEDFLCIDI